MDEAPLPQISINAPLRKTPPMKSTLAILPIAAALMLAGCATQPRQIPVWNATPGATVDKEQALAKCEYEIRKTPGAFDELSLIAGQPRLNDGGRNLFQLCMRSQGYAFGGTVPVPGAAS